MTKVREEKWGLIDSDQLSKYLGAKEVTLMNKSYFRKKGIHKDMYRAVKWTQVFELDVRSACEKLVGSFKN